MRIVIDVILAAGFIFALAGAKGLLQMPDAECAEGGDAGAGLHAAEGVRHLQKAFGAGQGENEAGSKNNVNNNSHFSSPFLPAR